jgi:KaiC/GvpD/RAD55 family RecA-like ATPase
MKIRSGIPGLDGILKGGFNEKSSFLVTGAPGTGKSIFAIQFIYQGCLDNEPGLYISCEETVESIKNYAKSLGLDLEKFEKKGLVVFLREEISLTKPLSIAKPLEIIRSKKIKRVVLDSLTYFEYASPTDIDFRKSLFEFLNIMRESNVTLLATSQENIQNIDILKYKPQDFLFDGLILLQR